MGNLEEFVDVLNNKASFFLAWGSGQDLGCSARVAEGSQRAFGTCTRFHAPRGSCSGRQVRNMTTALT